MYILHTYLRWLWDLGISPETTALVLTNTQDMVKRWAYEMIITTTDTDIQIFLPPAPHEGGETHQRLSRNTPPGYSSLQRSAVYISSVVKQNKKPFKLI